MGNLTMSFKDLNTYAARVSNGIALIDETEFANLMRELTRISQLGGTVFVAGNGGSFATASHFVTDLCKRSNSSKLMAFVLGANQSLLTMIGNDLGFEQIFSEELGIHGSESDLLILLSASGNSENLLFAAEVAKKMKIKVVGVTGFDGGELAKLADISIHTPSQMGEYALVEDAHSIVCHFISVTLRNEEF